MKKFIVLFLLALCVSTSFAKDIEVSGAMTDGDFKDFALELGAVIAFNPMQPAEPSGITGFDVSLEISATDINESKDYWENMTDGNDPSSLLMFTKIHVVKGLPYNIDIGAMYGTVADSNASAWGIEAKWAILEGTTLTPALAIRGTYSKMTGVSDVDLEQYAGDLLISKGFLMFTPYAGVTAIKLLAKENTSQDVETVDEYTYKGLVGVQITPFPLVSIKAEVSAGVIPQYNLSIGVRF